MFKKLGKKALPIIMATMLVASMTAVSVSATEESVVATETTVATVSATSEFIEEYTGVKLESDALDFDSVVPMISGISWDDLESLSSDFYEKIYNIEVYGADYSNVDFTSTSVTAYLPCESEGCYVAFFGYETETPVQVDAEYVDGYYKVQMLGNGSYYICDYPLAEGEGELIEQTLVDEKTGVSVTGMIPTDSKLFVVDLMAVVQEMLGGIEDYESEDAEVTVNEEVLELLDSIDGYMVYVVRNLDIAQTEGELAVSLPNDSEGYEVRYIHDVMGDSELYDTFYSAYETIEQELMEPTLTDEELAQQINTLIDSIMPVLASEYADGKYTVSNENLGIFMVVPTDSIYVTADDVKVMREEYASYYEEDPTEPTGVINTVVTEDPTQVVQQTVVQTVTPAQTTTTSSTSGKTVNTGDSRNIPMLLAVLGTATATIVAFRKKRLAK